VRPRCFVNNFVSLTQTNHRFVLRPSLFSFPVYETPSSRPGSEGTSIPGGAADAVAFLAVVAAVVPAAGAGPSTRAPVAARPHDKHPPYS